MSFWNPKPSQNSQDESSARANPQSSRNPNPELRTVAQSPANSRTESSGSANGESANTKLEPQVEAAIREVEDLLIGRSGKPKGDDSSESGHVYPVELVAAISSTSSDLAERSRARQLFIESRYFDEAIQNLSTADSPEQRVAAARTLGIVGSQRGSAALIGALSDPAPEVRRTAGEALAQIGGPTVSCVSLPNLPSGEMDWAAPEVDLLPKTAGLTTEVEAEPGTATAENTEATAPAPIDFLTVDLLTNANEVAGTVDIDRQEDAIATSLQDLERRMTELAVTRTETENKVRHSAQAEGEFRAQVYARRQEEEELAKRAEEEATRRRWEDEEKLKADRDARMQTEEKVRHLQVEEARLLVEVLNLMQTGRELAQKRAQIENAARAAKVAEAEGTRSAAAAQHNAELAHLRGEEETSRRAAEQARQRRMEVEAARQESEIQLQRLEEEKSQLATAEAARLAEADRMRREAENRNRAEQERLFQQVGELRRSAEEVARRRAEIEAARKRTEEDAQRLVETQVRMKTAEERRQQAETERLRLEADLLQRAETEQRLLEEAQAEQQRLEEAARRRMEEEEERLAKLDVFRKSMEAAAQARAEREREINSELESLQTADGEARRRIEEIEVHRRTANQKHVMVAEKLQRVEAEAHARRAEEDRILAKLEDVRANVAVEAEARANQEKHIKEEIELLRGLEEEQRQRIEEEMRRRSDAESRLQHIKDSYRFEEEARVKAETQLEKIVEGYQQTTEAVAEWHDEPAENLRPIRPATASAAASGFREEAAAATNYSFLRVDQLADSTVPQFLIDNLNSIDPFERAAALSSVAQSGLKDVFGLIVNFFDDQSPQVRNAAALALKELEPYRPVETFTRALDEGSPERRRNIGSAIAASGLANEALDALRGENREETYNALCLLFTMAKTGEVQPLIQAIEEHENVDVRMAAVKLLTLSGQSDIAEAAAKRRLEGQRSNAQTA